MWVYLGQGRESIHSFTHPSILTGQEAGEQETTPTKAAPSLTAAAGGVNQTRSSEASRERQRVTITQVLVTLSNPFQGRPPPALLANRERGRESTRKPDSSWSYHTAHRAHPTAHTAPQTHDTTGTRRGDPRNHHHPLPLGESPTAPADSHAGIAPY